MKTSILLIALSLIASFGLGQTTWYEIQLPTNRKLNAIDFPSDQVGYIVGDDNFFAKTEDGGATWMIFNQGGSMNPFPSNTVDVKFLNEDVGFMVTDGSIYGTEQGGSSWEVFGAVTADMCWYQAVFPFSESDFFAGGSKCPEGARIRRYENGSWTTGNVPMSFPDVHQRVIDISFISPTHGLAATKSEYILRTIDAGITWDTISTGIQDSLTSVIMVNDTLCYAGYEDINSQGAGVLKSVDGGLTWTQDVNSATFYYPNYLEVHAAPNGDIYSGAVPSFGGGGLIFETTDGTNWTYQNVDQPINGMASYGSDVTFAVGDSGYLIVNTPLAELGNSEVDQIEFDVFPNPFQDEISIENPTSEVLVAQLLDAQGRVVQNFTIGSNGETIRTAHLQQGVYFIQLEMNGDSRVKRLVKL